MFSSTADKSKLFHALRSYLASKDGPLRLERIARYALGLDWHELELADRRIIRGVVERCGFESTRWPTWFRTTAEDIAAVEATPAWLTRKAAA
jgi:hypothetical protein